MPPYLTAGWISIGGPPNYGAFRSSLGRNPPTPLYLFLTKQLFGKLDEVVEDARIVSPFCYTKLVVLVLGTRQDTFGDLYRPLM